MIEVYKIINLKYDACYTVALDLNDFNKDSKTRGNKHKLNQNPCKYNLRKHFFTNRIVAIWNSLPGHVVVQIVSIYLRIVCIIVGACKLLCMVLSRVEWIWKLQFRVTTLIKSVYT